MVTFQPIVLVGLEVHNLEDDSDYYDQIVNDAIEALDETEKTTLIKYCNKMIANQDTADRFVEAAQNIIEYCTTDASPLR